MPSPVIAPAALDLRGGAATASGHDRRCNEDAFVCGPHWFAVADGMGGHQAGDVASHLAVDEVSEAPPPGSVEEALCVIDRANARIRSAAAHASTTGMGTTLVAAVRMGDDVVVVSIGDSRCYRLAAAALTLVTRDHSHVQELVDLGRLTAGEVGQHPLRHVVTRALGVDADARPDVHVLRAPVGRLLLCSDGLTSELTSRAIGRVLAGVCDPQSAADRLVRLASRARDDVTAVVVDVTDGSV